MLLSRFFINHVVLSHLFLLAEVSGMCLSSGRSSGLYSMLWCKCGTVLLSCPGAHSWPALVKAQYQSRTPFQPEGGLWRGAEPSLLSTSHFPFRIEKEINS